MASLYTETYDLGIIGGGIAGAAVARDAALRGLSVVLFEKGAFASGASSKSSKLIHGGLRYLELAWNALKRGDLGEARKDLGFVFASLSESRILRRIAPALVRPLPLIVPVYADDRRGRLTVFAGCYFYFLLAFFSGGARVPSIFFGRRAALRALPALNPQGLLGAVKIWENRVDDKALVLATLESAKKNKARCLEHTTVKEYDLEAGGESFKLQVSGKSVEGEFHVKRLIDATGAWIDKTCGLGDEKVRALVLPVAGAHIELPAFTDQSALLQAKDGRFFFVVNHAGRARVGTTERVVDDVENVQPTDKEVDYLLASLKRYFPKKEFSKDMILSKDAGVRPLSAPDKEKDPHDVSREHEIRTSPSGCLHLVGVKLTDHRRAAARAVDRLMPVFGRDQKSRTHRLPL